VAWQRVDFYGWCPRCAAAKRDGQPANQSPTTSA
jgi:hypothetical protein